MTRRFELKFTMDNAAFGGCEANEVMRILEGVVQQIDGIWDLISPNVYTITDYNGNKVGYWEVIEDDAS